MKEKRRTLATNIDVMKEKGESLKMDLRQKRRPGYALYILHILLERGDIYLLLINRAVKK